jgi:hypothetical protein
VRLGQTNLVQLNPPYVAFTITKKTIVCGVELPHIGIHYYPLMDFSTSTSETNPMWGTHMRREWKLQAYYNLYKTPLRILKLVLKLVHEKKQMQINRTFSYFNYCPQVVVLNCCQSRLLGEKLNNKHPNNKMVLTKTPNVEDRFVNSIETKVRKEWKPNTIT